MKRFDLAVVGCGGGTLMSCSEVFSSPVFGVEAEEGAIIRFKGGLL